MNGYVSRYNEVFNNAPGEGPGSLRLNGSFISIVVFSFISIGTKLELNLLTTKTFFSRKTYQTINSETEGRVRTSRLRRILELNKVLR